MGFFDFNYNDKTIYIAALIEHTDKNIYFRNIHLFLDRAKQFILIKEAELVRENLWLSLRDIALSWWTSELFDIERRIVIYDNSIDEWIKLLVKRFK